MEPLLTTTLAIIGLLVSVAALGMLIGGFLLWVGNKLAELISAGTDDPKLWQVGEHRVKKTKKRPDPMNDAGYRGHRPPKKTCYKCIDCGQYGKYRPRFKSKPCYEVVE